MGIPVRPGGTFCERRNPGRRVVLYTPAPLIFRDTAVPLAGFAAIKGWLRRFYDRLIWTVNGRLVARPYNYMFLGTSNRGDEAIRIAIDDDIRVTAGSQELIIEEVLWGQLEGALRTGLVQDVDCFVIGGGGYYRFEPDGELHPALIQDFINFRRIRCPMLTYGSGVSYNIRPEQSGHFSPTALAGDMLREHFERLNYCIVRDRFSQVLFQEFSAKRIEVAPDPVLFLSPVPKPPPRRPGDPLRVGLNVAFHGPNSAAVLAQALPRMIGFLRSLREVYSARFTCFVHCKSEYAIVRLFRDSGLSFDVVDCEPRALADAYAGVDVHFCQMMHSSIMSVRCGVPTLVIAYDQKHHSFFDMIGMSRFCLSVHEATSETLLSRFDEMVRLRTELQHQLVTTVDQLRVERRQLLGKLSNMIASSASR